MTPERKALFMCASQCQGGHSPAGSSAAEALGVPFPIDMASLVTKARNEGENPAELWPWLIQQGYHHESTFHRFFTADEISAVVGAEHG